MPEEFFAFQAFSLSTLCKATSAWVRLRLQVGFLHTVAFELSCIQVQFGHIHGKWKALSTPVLSDSDGVEDCVAGWTFALAVAFALALAWAWAYFAAVWACCAAG